MKKVVVVDDDASIVRILCKVIESLGCVAEGFTSPVLALDSVIKCRPDVLVVDMMMPVADGIQFLRECRKKGIDSPAMMITGYTDITTTRMLPSNGIKKILPKPVRIGELTTELQLMLEE